MTWKCETRLDDIDPKALIEVTCKSCGLTRYESPRDLITKARLSEAFMDDVEDVLSCMGRHCRGRVNLRVVPVEMKIALSAE